MAVQPDLCLTWSETPKDRFSPDMAQFIIVSHVLGKDIGFVSTRFIYESGSGYRLGC